MQYVLAKHWQGRTVDESCFDGAQLVKEAKSSSVQSEPVLRMNIAVIWVQY